MASASAESTYNLLQSVWLALVSGCLLAVLVLGLRKLATRGPTRMNNAVAVTGYLILVFALVGAIAVQLFQ
jgi:hypothetical protein